MGQINIEFTSVKHNYSILKNDTNHDPSVKKSVYETYNKEIIFENFVINNSNLKKKCIYAKEHGFVKVVLVFKSINGTIILKVLKYNISLMFHHSISSDIMKIFYAHDIIPKPPLISIYVGSTMYKCFHSQLMFISQLL